MITLIVATMSIYLLETNKKSNALTRLIKLSSLVISAEINAMNEKPTVTKINLMTVRIKLHIIKKKHRFENC